MALTQNFQYSHMIGGGSTPIISVYEGSGQTFKAGEVLIEASGYATVAAADPSAATVLGLALADASGTQGTECLIIPALSFVVFEGQLQNAAGTATIAIATHMLTYFSINVTSHKWWVDTDDTSNKLVNIIGFKDAVGTLNGVVYFTFRPGVTFFGGAIT